MPRLSACQLAPSFRHVASHWCMHAVRLAAFWRHGAAHTLPFACIHSLSLLTNPDLTWIHPSPSHLLCQKNEKKKLQWKNEIFPAFLHRCPSFITRVWQEVGGLMWDVKAHGWSCNKQTNRLKGDLANCTPNLQFKVPTWDETVDESPGPKFWKGLIWYSQTFEDCPKVWSTLGLIVAKKCLVGHLSNHL